MPTAPQPSLSDEMKQAVADALETALTRIGGRTFSPRIKLLTIDDVQAATGLSRSAVYELVKAKKFPRPQEGLGNRTTLWRESAIIAWCDANDPNLKGGR